MSTSGAINLTVTASVNGAQASVLVHVVQSIAPPASSPALLTPIGVQEATPPGTFCGSACFGWFRMDYMWADIAPPEPFVTPYLDGDRWRFRLDQVQHTYRWGVKPLEPIGFREHNLTEQNASLPAFPLVMGMNLAQSKQRALDDFDTSVPTAALQGPPRVSYWNQNIAIQHENRHAYRFYEDPTVMGEWREEMQDFEAQDVEAPDKFVVFDCGQSATMIVDGVRGLFLPTLVTPLNTKHNAAVDVHLDVNGILHEMAVHGFTNPLYAPIRALVEQIQVP